MALWLSLLIPSLGAPPPTTPFCQPPALWCKNGWKTRPLHSGCHTGVLLGTIHTEPMNKVA